MTLDEVEALTESTLSSQLGAYRFDHADMDVRKDHDDDDALFIVATHEEESFEDDEETAATMLLTRARQP